MLDDNELLFDELYEKTKDCGRVQFINLLMEKKRENQELKKQLDELQAVYSNMFKCHCNRVQVETLLSQQKEFIKYLENEIKNSDICDVYVRGMKFNSAEKMIYKDILSKYKEIIGVKDD